MVSSRALRGVLNELDDEGGRKVIAVEKRRKGEEKEHTVRRENTHMTTPNKLFIVQTEDRIV
jgi:hypothetical protein